MKKILFLSLPFLAFFTGCGVSPEMDRLADTQVEIACITFESFQSEEGTQIIKPDEFQAKADALYVTMQAILKKHEFTEEDYLNLSQQYATNEVFTALVDEKAQAACGIDSRSFPINPFGPDSNSSDDV
ncbi:MAG: hypothetical protein ACD_28C00337G0009 [uncultured bacterium]|nr:MAG: hypothetical protein ACD_28C00337G0009 [uncultured bacterium]